MRGHVILTNYGPLAAALIPMLKKYGHGYVVLCPTLQEALELEERGIQVAVGDLDDPETYRRMRLDQAALMMTTRTDVINVNATFTARELSEDVPIVAMGASETSRDVLELAGATMVLRQEEVMGSALARRVSIRDSRRSPSGCMPPSPRRQGGGRAQPHSADPGDGVTWRCVSCNAVVTESECRARSTVLESR